MALRFNRQYNIGRAIRNLMTAILSLYVGGVMLSAFGTAMNATCSPLYSGLSLIGWTTATSVCNGVASSTNTITSTTGGAVLSVLGIAAIAQVVLEFVRF